MGHADGSKPAWVIENGEILGIRVITQETEDEPVHIDTNGERWKDDEVHFDRNAAVKALNDVERLQV